MSICFLSLRLGFDTFEWYGLLMPMWYFFQLVVSLELSSEGLFISSLSDVQLFFTLRVGFQGMPLETTIFSTSGWWVVK